MSRSLIVLLVFMLAFAPMSALADSVTKKEITYVALGDSLAAGVLNEGGIGEGYSGGIKSNLNTNGYNVTFSNKGIPGATTNTKLFKPEDIADADLITLSIGANDVLGPLKGSLESNPEAIPYLGVTEKELDGYKALAESQESNARDMLAMINQDMGVDISEVIGNIEAWKVNLPDGEDKKIIDEKLKVIEKIMSMDFKIDVIEEEEIEAIKSFLDNVNTASVGLRGAFENIAKVAEEKEKSILPLLNKVISVLKATEENIMEVTDVLNEAINARIEYETAKSVLELKQKVMADVEVEIGKVGTNLLKILGNIKDINPDVKIYVMGYYNAVPYLPPDLTDKLLPGLNAVIVGASNMTGATFIPTVHLFEGTNYLPTNDIHPNVEGYAAIANAFMQAISNDLPRILTLGEKTPVLPGQFITIDGTSVTLQLPNDLPDGTKLTISRTDKNTIAEGEDLIAIGDVLEFDFGDGTPEDKDEFTLMMDESEFILTMGFDSEKVNKSVGIYHYGEDNGWVMQEGGKVNSEENSITLNVSEFSSYGVFTEVKKEEVTPTPEKPETEDNETTTVTIEDDGDDQGEKVASIDTGNVLPDTATDHYNWLMVGSIMFVVGLGSLLVIRGKLSL